jgi:hypothetical protein
MLKQSSYTFKSQEDIPLFVQTRIELQMIFIDLCMFCDKNNLPRPTLTSTIRPKLPRSISTTHEDGRAVDIRSKVYSQPEIDMMVNYINKKYAEEYGTAPAGKPVKCLIYEEIGEDSHLHLQVKN